MGVGECWGGLRRPLRENFSFSDIKEIAGAAGLAVYRLGHLQQRQGSGGASKGQLIDNLDLLFAERPLEDQDRISAATIREMVRRAQPARREGMEDQISAALAAVELGPRDGEAYPLPPPGQSVGINDPPARRPDYLAAIATASGVNEAPVPLREGASPADGASAVGGTPVNTHAVNARSGLSAGTSPVPLGGRGVAGTSGQAMLTLSGPPPDIPEPGPALIEPVWGDGRLALLKGLPANDMADDGVVNLIAAVRRGFEWFILALSAPGTNLHPALRSYIEGVPDLLFGVPDQVQVFEMGHAVEHLEAQQDVIQDELGGALANQYGVLVEQFQRCMVKFPCWRELVSGANASPLPADQAEHAVPVARALAAALATEAAGAVVDPSVVEALTGLADAAAMATSPAEKGLLDFDLVSSIRRIMTALYQPVIYCWNEVGSGALSELKKLPGQVGSGTVKWGGGTLLAIAALHVGAAPLAASVATLATHYPALTWLLAVEEFLKFLATLPKG